MKRNRFYVGLQAGTRAVFTSPFTPTEGTHGHLYAAVIGPFTTEMGALFMREYGAGNPHLQTVADAERLARLSS